MWVILSQTSHRQLIWWLQSSCCALRGHICRYQGKQFGASSFLPSSLPPDDYQENLDKRSREKIKQKLIMCLCFREWQCDFHSNWLFLYWFENGIKALQAKPNLHHHSSSLVLACNPPRVPSLQKSSLSRYCPESIESDNILIIMSSWNNSPSSPLSVGAKKWVPRLLIIARALINSCQFLFEV